MSVYTAPKIEELGTIAELTRGDKFAFKFDGMSLAEVISQLVSGHPENIDIGTSYGTSR